VAMFKLDGEGTAPVAASPASNISVLPTRSVHKPARASRTVRTANAALAISDHDEGNWQEF